MVASIVILPIILSNMPIPTPRRTMAKTTMDEIPKLNQSPIVGIKPMRKSAPNFILVKGIVNLLSKSVEMVSIHLNSGWCFG